MPAFCVFGTSLRVTYAVHVNRAAISATAVAIPLAVALSNDYEVVVRGLAQMLAPFSNRVRVVELDVQMPVSRPVDITLCDTFSQQQANGHEIDLVLANPAAGKVVIFTWNLHAELVANALNKGVSGYLSKSLTAEQLVAALEQIHRGQVVVSRELDAEPVRLQPPLHGTGPEPGSWPGQAEGLTARESEVVALITQGYSNQQIAERSYLSINSVKSYIRGAYRKMGVTRRSQAVLWGVRHGMLPAPKRVPVEHR